jgi:asparagine synthase (glutamine-hydrolysing)
MDAMAARWGIRQLRFSGDDGWPLHDAETWPYNPNRPIDNAYRILKERAYSTAHNNGVSALLTGGGGDHLYGGYAWWLVDRLASGRLLSAAGGVARAALRGPILQEPGVRRLGSLILRGRRPRADLQPPPWMSPSSHGLLETRQWTPKGIEDWRRPDHAASICGPMIADGIAAETFHASRNRLDLRHPYRDRRLVEFMLAIPADQLYRDGRFKHVLRVAMDGILPETIRHRVGSASLLPLYQRGLVERENTRIERLLSRRDALWRRFVEPDYLHHLIPARIAEGRDGADVLVPWYCSYMELWRQLAVAGDRRPAGAAVA